MKMMRRIPGLVGTVCLTVLLAGCSKVPFQELKAAQTAREEARDVALAYAPEEYNAALALFDQARTEIEAQNAKSGITRSYTKAVDLLAQARQGFEASLAKATAIRDEQKGQAETKSAAAAAAVAELRAALEKVRKTSRNKADRDRWASELEGLDATLVDANEYVTTEYYREAIGYFDTVLQDCERIKTEIAGS